MVLRAYIDESEHQASEGPPVFVMGGFIAPAESWAKFSDEWQEVLDMRPRCT